MSRKAKICQNILIAYFGFGVIATLLKAERQLPFVSSYAGGVIVLTLVARLVLLWKISTAPRNWSLALGIISTYGAVALPFSNYIQTHFPPTTSPGWLFAALVAQECIFIVLAVCGFMLRSELVKAPHPAPEPAALSVPSPAASGLHQP